MGTFQLHPKDPIRQGFVVSSMRSKPPSAPSLPKEEPKASSLSDEQRAKAKQMPQRAVGAASTDCEEMTPES